MLFPTAKLEDSPATSGFQLNRKSLAVEIELFAQLPGLDSEVPREVIENPTVFAARIVLPIALYTFAQPWSHGVTGQLVDAFNGANIIGHEFVKQDVDAATRGQQVTIAHRSLEQAPNSIRAHFLAAMVLRRGGDQQRYEEVKADLMRMAEERGVKILPP